MPIYSDEARGLIHGPFRKHMGRPEDRTPLGSSVGLGSFGDVLRLRETQSIADGREADYSEAEAQRRSAEVLRNMAEENRQEAETARETAEQGRQEAETERSGSETSRVSNEEARVTAEQARAGAESARVTAEVGRVQAELEREAGKITSASVSVDDNVGTPEATVTLGPPSSGGRSISFDFRNLKGDPVNLVPITNGQIDTIAGDGTVTNDNVLTGTGLTYLWSWIKSKFASLVSGAVQIVQGGTGATTASGARNSLGVPTASSIASTEGVTATRNHAVGDYFMLGDVLMKATAAIATGETINASKATPATVQGQIDTLRDSVVRVNTDENVSLATIGSSGVDLIKIRMLKTGVGDYLLDAGEYGIELYNRGVGTVWKMLSAPQEATTGFVINTTNVDSIKLQRYKALNGIVSVDVRVKIKVAYTADSNLQLGTIPSAYCPSYIVYAPTNQEGSVALIGSNGNVAFYGTRAMNAETEVEFIVTFIK